ncbi:MAG: PucR family transcriptional regulator [Comamonadaceae bacterium]|nr:MAG: PucR family transcriptional regulator [Comamonadaceae bacterium]
MVPTNLGSEVVGIARDAFRLGMEQELATAYHAGHHALWRHWMRLAFAVSSDPAALQEALDVASRSLERYIDDTLTALAELLESERAELARGSHAQKFETVSLVLEGAPLNSDRASERLNYRFDGCHVAAVLWMDPRDSDRRALQHAAEVLDSALGVRSSLHIIASSSSMWTWLANPAPIDAAALAAVTSQVKGVRIAVGPEDSGVEGFRRSHLYAVETQRLLQRLPHLQIARFTDVQLVALTTQDDAGAREFVARTLGRLATADPELRATLRMYVREQFNASRAARALFTHRNTLLNRLHRAEGLLPLSLTENSLEIGVALEIAHWLGPPTPTAAAHDT